MKRKVFSRGDMEPIQKGLTEIVHREALALKEQRMLDEIYEDEPFKTRLTRIRYASVEACRVIYRSIMGIGWRRLQRRGNVPLREASTTAFLYRRAFLGPDIIGSSIYRVRPKIAGVGSWRSTLASGFGLLYAALRQIPHIDLLDPSSGCPRSKTGVFLCCLGLHKTRE